mmetsp:Transcript_9932/g.28220  ORF Transcript_9932/g.28220 Transcript_9932/m.28220 type:complete len:263 (-) Transcript_9932:1086-1874(-)
MNHCHLFQRKLGWPHLPVPDNSRVLDDFLHPFDSPLNLFVCLLPLLWVWEQLPVHTQVFLGQALVQVLVHELRQVRRERRHDLAQRHENVKRHGKGHLRVFRSVGSLHSLSVEPNVHICEVVDELHEVRQNGVQAVGFHLLLDVFHQTRRGSNHPSVQHIRSLVQVNIVWVEINLCVLEEPLGILDEESVRIVPRQENFFNHAQDPIFLEFERLRSHDGGVHKVHPQCIRAISIHDQLWIRVILQPFTHFLSIGGQHKSVAD